VLLGFRDGCDIFRGSAFFNDLLCRLSLVVQFPIPDWIFIRRVENGLIEELVIHISLSPDSKIAV
jgi:hypothetical protein